MTSAIGPARAGANGAVNEEASVNDANALMTIEHELARICSELVS